MNYEYQIAGLRVLLELPFSISVQPSSQAFLSAPSGGQADVRFLCRPVPSLPQPPVGGHEESNRCYAETAAERQVFFRPSPTGAPYACVTWRAGEPRVLRCCYLAGEESRINYSMKICDMLGLESLLLQFRGMLLHCAFIRWQGQGILFSADSGVGKSTQAALWEQHRGAETLNGDRAGLMKPGGVWTAYGLPYAGSSRVYRNASAPISAVFMLEQAPVNQVLPLSPAAALRRLYPQVTIHSWDTAYVQDILPILEDFVTSVPVYLLRCRPDAGATEAALAALRRKGIAENE